jgi:hypothetical protein
MPLWWWKIPGKVSRKTIIKTTRQNAPHSSGAESFLGGFCPKGERRLVICFELLQLARLTQRPVGRKNHPYAAGIYASHRIQQPINNTKRRQIFRRLAQAYA